MDSWLARVNQLSILLTWFAQKRWKIERIIFVLTILALTIDACASTPAPQAQIALATATATAEATPTIFASVTVAPSATSTPTVRTTSSLTVAPTKTATLTATRIPTDISTQPKSTATRSATTVPTKKPTTKPQPSPVPDLAYGSLIFYKLGSYREKVSEAMSFFASNFPNEFAQLTSGARINVEITSGDVPFGFTSCVKDPKADKCMAGSIPNMQIRNDVFDIPTGFGDTLPAVEAEVKVLFAVTLVHEGVHAAHFSNGQFNPWSRTPQQCLAEESAAYRAQGNLYILALESHISDDPEIQGLFHRIMENRAGDYLDPELFGKMVASSCPRG